MKKYGVAMACALVLSACGGGSDSSSDSNSGSSQEPSLIAHASWLAGASLTYQRNSVMSGNNTVNTSFRMTRSVAAADGSYTVKNQDLSAYNVINGIPFGGLEAVGFYDAQGRLLRVTNQVDGGPVVVCNYSPSRAPLPKPLLQNSTWTADWTRTCGSGPALTWQLRHGHVVGVETVTVPAGTFETVHGYEEVDVTNASIPYARHEVLNTWYDRASGMTIKFDSAITYSKGAPSTGYVSHFTDQLSAMQRGS